MSGKSSAVAGVAAEIGVLDGTHAVAGSAETDQADLLRDFSAEVDLFADGAIPPPATRGRGRPVGSVNRSTTQLKKLLLQRGYRDPAEFLAAVMSQDTKTLADSLSCDKLEAAKLQRQAATDLMPYFHQRMPQETDQKPAEARPLVMIMTGDATLAQRREDGTLSIYDVQRNQEVSDADATQSHDDGSHDEG